MAAKSDPTGLAPRLAALRLLSGVITARQPLTEEGLRDLPPQGRARALGLASGVLRHRDRLDAAIDGYLNRNPPLRMRNILRLAAWEMLIDGIPPHAAVDAAVNAAKSSPKTRHLAGLANAVARRLSEHGDLDATPQRLPEDLRTALERAYGADAVAAMETVFAQSPPLDLTPRDPDATAALAGALAATPLPTGSLRLGQRAQISALPGYDDGAWWVQDAAAALPVRMLGNINGARALDLAAAPGGKTMQLAAGGADVTALDISPDRLTTLRSNLERTRLAARIEQADMLGWSPDGAFDVIVLDAPCSATGTIRRHPELPLLRQKGEAKRMIARQARMLDRALTWLAPGGRLVFCTCSLLPGEGEGHTEGRTIVPATAQALGVPEHWIVNGCLRTRPDYWAETGGIDGFFACVVQN